MISRRELIGGAATLAAAGMAVAQQSAPGAAPRNMVISSHNGLRACARAMEMLKSGVDTLDAVIAGVNINEEDPADHSVGYGGLPNEEGVVELDASVMHGPTRRCGSVAAICNVKTPSKVARTVMQQTDHIMLVGAGATRFAREMGFHEDDLLTEDSRLAWMVWKKSLRDPSGHSNWTSEVEAGKPSAWLREAFPEAGEATLAWAEHVALHPPTGTINCLSLNAKGEMSGVTTTSGLAWKIAGRVGDSPIIGAGLYVDQEVGGAGSTGRGEENIRVAGAHTIVENMRHGMTPRDACLDALQRIAHNFHDNRARLAPIDIRFYALRRDGQYAGASLWSHGQPNFAVNDGGDSRLEDCVALLDA
jgi:N4-(beta-N-acetylglucosaminyl)-L-asparaginase